ncbi:uncharacterized protein LOC141703025 [Apium graveolens]|uniref:BHLH domain-containing protein n=1 Tax=Apium graveolens TaxID=4045 RepID=A0A6L5B8A4_APIGR|nr:hypothetical protein AG4045_026099 [Apium graveolens]
MNALPDMLHCMSSAANVEMSVFERQQARMKWQQHQEMSFFGGNEVNMYSTQAQAPEFDQLMSNDSGFASLFNCAVKPDPGMDNGWPDYGKFGGDSDFLSYGYGNVNVNELSCAISRTISCPPAVAAATAEPSGDHANGNLSVFHEKISSGVGRVSFKKRKADKALAHKVIEDECIKEKKTKGIAEEGESKITTEQNCNTRETSNDTSKENSKISEVQKPDYIHVRARRGQATDSHSLAERVRREKISERMKYLQDLVPGCNKITGKAGMLDEIINYVQSLQRQVEFLSMKLATVNPRMDFNIDNFFAKEMFPAFASNFTTTGVTSEMAGPSYLQYNTLQQAANSSDMTLKRTISTPISHTEALVDSSCFNPIQPLGTWESELQNLYNAEFQQGNSTSYQSQPFTGCIGGNNLKMEM